MKFLEEQLREKEKSISDLQKIVSELTNSKLDAKLEKSFDKEVIITVVTCDI